MPEIGALTSLGRRNLQRSAEPFRSPPRGDGVTDWRVTAATIVLHGASDTNVPVVEAEQVVDSLKKRGIPVEYVLFPDEGHGWRKTANRIRSAVAVTRWFEKYLKAGG